jgi:hypothetical protein
MSENSTFCSVIDCDSEFDEIIVLKSLTIFNKIEFFGFNENEIFKSSNSEKKFY